MLDLTETWTYTCGMDIPDDTTNVVTVVAEPTDAAGEPLPANIPAVSDTDDAYVEVVDPAIGVTKTLAAPAPTLVTIGDLITFNIWWSATRATPSCRPTP